MKCPRCGYENQPDVRFCSHCGLSRQMQQPPINVQKDENALNYNLPMNFHKFYAIATLVISILNILGYLGMIVLSIIGGIMVDDFHGESILPYSGIVVFAIFNIIMAILLLNRKRAGNIMRLISNIASIALNTLSSTVFLLMGGVSIICGVFVQSEYSDPGFALMFIGILAICIALLRLVAILAYNIITMVYYHKREHMFK